MLLSSYTRILRWQNPSLQVSYMRGKSWLGQLKGITTARSTSLSDSLLVQVSWNTYKLGEILGEQIRSLSNLSSTLNPSNPCVTFRNGLFHFLSVEGYRYKNTRGPVIVIFSQRFLSQVIFFQMVNLHNYLFRGERMNNLFMYLSFSRDRII